VYDKLNGYLILRNITSVEKTLMLSGIPRRRFIKVRSVLST